MSDARARKSRQRVNLTEVAARAGVSVATASRALRGTTKVSAEARQRVIEAAQDLAYVNVLQALNADPAPRRAVAVIVPFITRWFFSTVTAGAVDHLRAHGYDVLLYHLGTADFRDRFFTRMPLAGRVDGVLSLSMPLTEEHTLSLRALDLPLVSVGSSIPGSPSVGIDEAGAARTAMQHLLNLRHRRIGLIAGRPDDPRFEFRSSSERRLGYESALTAAGIEPDARLVVDGAHGIEGGATAMTELLSRPDLPSAVLAEYDELAIGALWALRRAGLDVPGDISVIGVDDHEMAEFLELTTVAQGVTEQGRIAARMLLQLLGEEEGTPPGEPIVIPTRLVLRGTTAPPRLPPGDPQQP